MQTHCDHDSRLSKESTLVFTWWTHMCNNNIQYELWTRWITDNANIHNTCWQQWWDQWHQDVGHECSPWLSFEPEHLSKTIFISEESRRLMRENKMHWHTCEDEKCQHLAITKPKSTWFERLLRNTDYNHKVCWQSFDVGTLLHSIYYMMTYLNVWFTKNKNHKLAGCANVCITIIDVIKFFGFKKCYRWEPTRKRLWNEN